MTGAVGPAFFAASAANDPDYANVWLRLPFDGANGATATTDLSQSPKSIFFGASAQLSTSSPKFGSAELVNAGAGVSYAWISAGTTADAAFFHDGTTAWTYEVWLRCANFSATHFLMDTTAGSSSGQGVYCAVNTDRSFTFFISRSVASSFIISTSITAQTGLFPNDSNYHFVRITFDPALSTGAGDINVDGGSTGTLDRQTGNAYASGGSSSDFKIGGYGVSSGENWAGGIDDVRVTKLIRPNVVPTAAFPTS